MAVLPEATRFALRNATLPAVLVDSYTAATREGLVPADIVIGDGVIEAVTAPGGAPADLPGADLDGDMVWPCFVDMHTHIDKGHIWERQPNPTGDFEGALEAAAADQMANWTAEDIAARMQFSLQCAYAHGTKLLRTHLDTFRPQHRRSFELFSDMRDRWKGRIDLQAVALFPLEAVDDRAFFDDIVATVAEHGGLLGGVTNLHPGLEGQLETLFRAAAEAGLDVDLHVDETLDHEILTLHAIALAKAHSGFDGAVTVGHCCSLAQQDEETAARTIDRVAETGISVVSLPMCNMYLQDRGSERTPRLRSVTMVHELLAAGVPTAVASDNTRDPFYPYGDLDPVEVLRESVRILHLDHPIDRAPEVVTRTPADILRRPDVGRIAAGLPADLVLFNARYWSEFLSRPQADRLVMRGGAQIDTTLPDYRELDPLIR